MNGQHAHPFFQTPPAPAWKPAMLESGVSVEWCPVLQTQHHFIGLLSHGDWVFEKRDGTLELIHKHTGSATVAYMEKPLTQFKAELSAELTLNGFDAELAQMFPFNAVVRCGLESPSDYWAGLALFWLEALGYHKSLIAPLKNIAFASWASQKNRHLARRLLARWMNQRLQDEKYEG